MTPEQKYAEAVRTHRLSTPQALLLRRVLSAQGTRVWGAEKRTARSLKKKGLVTIEVGNAAHALGSSVSYLVKPR